MVYEMWCPSEAILQVEACRFVFLCSLSQWCLQVAGVRLRPGSITGQLVLMSVTWVAVNALTRASSCEVMSPS